MRARVRITPLAVLLWVAAAMSSGDPALGVRAAHAQGATAEDSKPDSVADRRDIARLTGFSHRS